MKKPILLLSAIVISVSSSSCNTVAGIGKDMKNFGNSMENTAIKTSNR